MYSANQNPKPQEVQAGALGAGPDTDYNFDLIPPNFEDAKLHRVNNRLKYRQPGEWASSFTQSKQRKDV